MMPGPLTPRPDGTYDLAFPGTLPDSAHLAVAADPSHADAPRTVDFVAALAAAFHATDPAPEPVVRTLATAAPARVTPAETDHVLAWFDSLRARLARAVLDSPNPAAALQTVDAIAHIADTIRNSR